MSATTDSAEKPGGAPRSGVCSSRPPRGVRWTMTILMVIALPCARATQADLRVSWAGIERRVVAALPTDQGRRATVVSHMSLTASFATRARWTFVLARVPGMHFSAAQMKPVQGGPLAECFVRNAVPHCHYSRPPAIHSERWFDIPLHFLSLRVVHAGPNRTRPLLLFAANSAVAMDGGHAIFTRLYTYDRARDRFSVAFADITGSNNNQRTQFMTHGPLRGDVIETVPTGTPPFVYWVSVYAMGQAGRYERILRYRSDTRYGDGNRLSVVDSEMANILHRLGKWHPGEPLPIPRHRQSFCAGGLVLRHWEEWCRPKAR